MGAHAVLDGYYRESVANFSTSLERFHEFAVQTLLLKEAKSNRLFEGCWKAVSNQSERQLGAFLFLWASNFKSQPRMLSTEDAKFRNAVIHKGKIPSRAEAVDFGNLALKTVRTNMLELQSAFPDVVIEAVSRNLATIQKQADGVRTSTICESTIVSLSAGEAAHHEGDLESHLSALAKRRETASELQAHISGKGAGR
jgi:hypothetical protein